MLWLLSSGQITMDYEMVVNHRHLRACQPVFPEGTHLILTEIVICLNPLLVVIDLVRFASRLLAVAS